MSYCIPTSNPIKNSNLGDGFILLTIAISVSSASYLLRRWNTGFSKCNKHLASLIPISFFLALCSLMVDWSLAMDDLHHLQGRDPHRARKLAVQKVYLASNEFLKNWNAQEKRKKVSVLFLAQKSLRYESHSFRSITHFTGIERAEVRVRQSIVTTEEILQPRTLQYPPAELLFVPRAINVLTSKRAYLLHDFQNLSATQQEALSVGLPKVGYRRIDTIPISRDFELDVYRFFRVQNYALGDPFP